MTGAKIATLLTIAAIVISGTGYVAKLQGDKLYLNEEDVVPTIVEVGKKEFITGEAYQQEKLYDLQDKAFEFELQEKYEGSLDPRKQEERDRLLKRIDRLQQEIQQ